MTTGPAAVIDRITLIVSDLDRSEDDYITTFGCAVEQRDAIEPSVTSVLGIPHARGRSSSTSTDLWFQHMAIVVNDMTRAHERVMTNPRFRMISRGGPVRLPDSSGGVTAFKFRDHDGHPLELLAFPAGHGPGEWRSASGGGLFLGVDHTAIAISDTARSANFFGAVFGFSAGPGTENRGPEQDALDDVDDVRVRVTPLARGLPAPRMELLSYHVGRRRPIAPDTVSNDITATHCVVNVASLEVTAAALARYGRPLSADDLMTRRGGIRAALVEGPDRHRFLVEERAGLPTASRLTYVAGSSRHSVRWENAPTAGWFVCSEHAHRTPGASRVMIRVLLADDQALIRSGIRSLLDAEDDIEVVGEAVDGRQAVALAAEYRPDIALVDIQMPVLDGIEATRQIVADERLENVRVVILTNFGLDEYIFRALRAGAAGFLLKDMEPTELLQALRVVMRGDSLLSPAVTRSLISEFVARPPDAVAAAGMEELTNREREVVALVAHGLSNDEIATTMVLSPATAKTHVSRAMIKLGARDRAQLVVFAYQAGLVSPRDTAPPR